MNRLKSAVAAGLLAICWPASGMAGDLGLPLDCRLGEDCFVQQFADMDAGAEAADPFCGSATYDGHDGTDFRVLSMADVARGVNVLAMSDGEVLRGRDGVPDRLVLTEDDRAAAAGRECGNGLVLRGGDGIEAQYCHLKEGSIAVRPGQRVRKGDVLGQVGASGMAEFPHVHVTLRREGAVVEPLSGRTLGTGCAGGQTGGQTGAPLFAPDAVAAIGTGAPQVIASGVTDRAVAENELAAEGPAPAATTGSEAVVGWAWLINLAKGDGITLRLVAPDGGVVSEQSVPPLDRSKATYVLYVGRKRAPLAGAYAVEVTVTRGRAQVVRSRAPVAVP